MRLKSSISENIRHFFGADFFRFFEVELKSAPPGSPIYYYLCTPIIRSPEHSFSPNIGPPKRPFENYTLMALSLGFYGRYIHTWVISF